MYANWKGHCQSVNSTWQHQRCGFANLLRLAPAPDWALRTLPLLHARMAHLQPAPQAMKRLTMSLDDELSDAFDALVRERGYENRSEAFRDLLRQDLGNTRLAEIPDGPCVATLSYVYNHYQRQLASRLNDLQHDHHELTVSTMHAHLDHEHCIETVILRGRSDNVRAFAQSIIAQPGVTHGQLNVIPATAHHQGGHEHLNPATKHPAQTAKPVRGKAHRH